MSNTRSSGYRRKNYDNFAYDKLGPKVRRALQEAVISWDADWCLREVRKHGADHVIRKIRDGDKIEAARGWQMKPGQKATPSSYKACRVSILRANW
jgi:hypothetical protein